MAKKSVGLKEPKKSLKEKRDEKKQKRDAEKVLTRKTRK